MNRATETSNGARRPSRSMLVALALSVATAVGALGCVGCVGRAATKIEAGESPSTGEAAYDDFFKTVLDVREQAKRAADEETAARDELGRAVGSESGSSAEGMVGKTANSAKKLHDFGVRLHLQLLPTARLVVARSGDTPEAGETEALLRGVESAANKSMALARRLAELGTLTATLEKQRTELREATATKLDSLPSSKREEIEKELDGSKAVLAEASDASARVAGSASRFLLDLARAVETGATDAEGPPPAAACPPENAKTAKKAAAPPGRGRPSKPPAGHAPASARRPAASPTAAPAAKPARKAKSGDDFEP